MKTKFIKPDFCNNIVNISATIAQFLGCPNDKPTLPVLEKELKKGYKNVVFMILDGMGTHPVNINLDKDSFFRRNIKKTLTSVFPSTTTCATTTYLTNEYPMEHGWFGWSLYFEQINRAVDIFLEQDSYTRENIEKGFVKKALPIEPFYKSANSDYAVSAVVPEYWDSDGCDKYIWNDFEGFLAHIENICKREGKQFVYAYLDEPDHTMHGFGVSSKEAHEVINGLNDGIEKLYSKISDTLFIISADHGQIDVEEIIELYKDEELKSMLEWPLYLEVAATAFKVKPECRENFVKVFNKKYGEDFELFKTQDMIEDNYFGGNFAGEHAKLLGDYIAVGKTHKIMKLTPLTHDFKGHHTSLTEEMEVPLIIIGSRK